MSLSVSLSLFCRSRVVGRYPSNYPCERAGLRLRIEPGQLDGASRARRPRYYPGITPGVIVDAR